MIPDRAPPAVRDKTPSRGRSREMKASVGPMLTHIPLLLLTAAYFALLLRVPLWIALIPGVVIAHRLGTLLHEYIHGIPFRRYRANHAVVTVWDGLLLLFGSYEMFRVSHLLHHQWLNSDHDDARRKTETIGRGRIRDVITGLEVVQYLMKFVQVLGGAEPRIRRGRMLVSSIISCAVIVGFILVGRGDVPAKMGLITLLTVLVPVSLQSAIEHYSPPENRGFANEYRVLLPRFNINRHIHHHENPSLPWYRLQWRTERPLNRRSYVSYWYHVFIKRDYELMRPMGAEEARGDLQAE